MLIEDRKVVHIHYTLTNEAGEVLDRSTEDQPLAYLHGSGNIIPGLENALDGKSEGDAFSVTIPPADAYGERSDALKQQVPRSAFQGVDEISEGMRFQAQSEHGQQIVTVTEVADDTVTIDANHPLAGETLKFDIEVAAVREASEEELAHGHVHGPEGHQH